MAFHVARPKAVRVTLDARGVSQLNPSVALKGVFHPRHSPCALGFSPIFREPPSPSAWHSAGDVEVVKSDGRKTVWYSSRCP